MSSLVFENVTKMYSNDIIGVVNVNLEIKKGEFIFLAGRSGAGKSTILQLASKEVMPTEGEIYFDGKTINNMPKKEIPYYRRQFGIVHQQADLLEEKTAYENVAFAMLATEQDPKRMTEAVPTALGIVGMRDKGELYPRQMSGGEKFRVTLARAIVNNPLVLLADEPTANLDPDTAWDIMCLLEEINSHGVTVMVATHAKLYVNIMKKRVVTFSKGHILTDVRKGMYGTHYPPIASFF